MRPQDIGKDLHVMYNNTIVRTMPEYSISMIDGWEVRGGVDDSVKLLITIDTKIE